MQISGRDTESACESVGMTQETHDHNYFRTGSVVNKVGGYTENPEKPQNLGVGACTGMDTCSGQYGISLRLHLIATSCINCLEKLGAKSTFRPYR